MKRMAAACMVVMLWAAMLFSIGACRSFALSEDAASIKRGMNWTLSSRWSWNASGVGDHAGWTTETERWNDILTVQEVSGGELTLRLKRVGEGSLEAYGSFIISGRTRDTWTIDREYLIKVNATTFRDVDGRPVEWVIDTKGLEMSRMVPQMWTDKDYHYIEVQFRVSGSDRFSLGGVTFDTWVLTYGNLTTGFWSAEGNHSTGFKEETLEYDQARGLLLRHAYHGIYGMKTHEGGWEETETFAANATDSNFGPLKSVENGSLAIGAGLVGATAAAGIATLVILHRRRIRARPSV